MNKIISSFPNLPSSWDHRIIQVGKDFKEVNSPDLKPGSAIRSDQLTQGFIESGFLILQDQVLNSES